MYLARQNRAVLKELTAFIKVRASQQDTELSEQVWDEVEKAVAHIDRNDEANPLGVYLFGVFG